MTRKIGELHQRAEESQGSRVPDSCLSPTAHIGDSEIRTGIPVRLGASQDESVTAAEKTVDII